LAELTPPPGGKKPPGKKILGLPVPVVIGGAAALLAFGVVWWRRRSKGAATTATTSATRSSSTSSTDFEGQLEELQAEIDQLTGAAGGGGSSGGGTATTTKTTTTTKTSAPAAPGPVSDLTVANKSATEVVVSWRPPQFASHAPTSTTYLIQLEGKDKAAHNIGSRTSYNIGGLKPHTAYTVKVAASGGPYTSKAFTTEAKK
jgi:hypothetical protein